MNTSVIPAASLIRIFGYSTCPTRSSAAKLQHVLQAQTLPAFNRGPALNRENTVRVDGASVKALVGCLSEAKLKTAMRYPLYYIVLALSISTKTRAQIFSFMT